MQEIWKDIKGYEGLYQVSNTGKVKSLDRYSENEKYIKGQEIKQFLNRGKLRVSLSKNKNSKHYYVNRLVAINFIDNPNNYRVVKNINGNLTDNNVTNLEWVEYTDTVYKFDTFPKRHENNKKGETLQMFDFNNKLVKEFSTIDEAIIYIKENLNIKSSSTAISSSISRCCNNYIKSAYKYIWKRRKAKPYMKHMTLKEYLEQFTDEDKELVVTIKSRHGYIIENKILKTIKFKDIEKVANCKVYSSYEDSEILEIFIRW